MKERVFGAFSYDVYHLVCFDGCVADGHVLEADCRWEILDDGFSVQAMRTEVSGQSSKNVLCNHNVVTAHQDLHYVTLVLFGSLCW